MKKIPGAFYDENGRQIVAWCEPEGFHQFGEYPYENYNAADMLKRLAEVLEAPHQMAMAEILKVRQSQISDVKRRNIAPIRWLRQIIELGYDVNPDWILTGKEPKKLSSHSE